MNAAQQKYVVSRTLGDVDAWSNSVLLRGEATETVADLKDQPEEDLGIIGSASLVGALHAVGLIDHYMLQVTPRTLGAGVRLFERPAPLTGFGLTRSVVSTTG